LNYFDQKRNEFLACIYSGNFRDAENVYKAISQRIHNTSELSELDQKAINQLQQAAKRFRPQLIENSQGGLMAAYEAIRKRLARAVRWQTKNIEFIGYDQWAQKTGLTEDITHVMFKTVSTLQMTVGCSISCRRCNEWALPVPRKHFTFDAATRLIRELFDAGNSDFALYCASDPLDWRCGEKNIVDIIGFMSDRGYKSRYGLLTKIPRGSGNIVKALLTLGADIGFSITDKNRSKAERIKDEAGIDIEVQHDFDQLLIPAGLDEDFISIKSSITDNYGTEITPEGAFLIVPAFTSSLYPTGQCRVPVTHDTRFFLKKRVGRDALPIQYFKPLEAVDSDGREFIPNELFDVQIANILLDNGSDQLTPPGMMNLREYFKTYEPDAIMRRRGLLPAVAKGLKKDILLNGKDKEESRKKRYTRFRQAVGDYSRTCRISEVQKLKINSFSFYLESISRYLKSHPAEGDIIRFLRRQDREKAINEYRALKGHGRPVYDLITNRETDTFNMFQILMFQLMEDPDNEEVHGFIRDHPADATDIL
jgi:hypothetical protein